MLKPQGYAVIVAPDTPMVERDTITCHHCQRVVFVKAGSGATVYLLPDASGQYHEEPGAFCRVCMHAICLICHRHGRCIPFERQLEKSEARDRFRRSLGV